MKNKASIGADISQQHSSNNFINYFNSKIDTIRDKIVTVIRYCYNFCSTHLNDRSTCSVQSIQTVSVPRIVRSIYTFNAGSRKNMTVIKPEKC